MYVAQPQAAPLLAEPQAAPRLEPEYGRDIGRKTKYWILDHASSNIQGDLLKSPLL